MQFRMHVVSAVFLLSASTSVFAAPAQKSVTHEEGSIDIEQLEEIQSNQGKPGHFPQNWRTTDDFMQDGTSLPLHACSGPGANFAVGFSGPFSNQSWIVRKSSDDGVSWATVDSFRLAGSTRSSAEGCAVAPDGSLYVYGHAVVVTTGSTGRPVYKSRVVTRKSADGGATWTTVSDLAESPCWMEFKLAADSFGNLYSAGTMCEGSYANLHAIVRKSSDGGVTWSQINDYQTAPGKSAYAMDIAAGPAGEVYVAGFGRDQTGARHWLVRGSNDGGVTWKNVDDFVSTIGRYNFAYGVAAAPTGEVYSTGVVYNDSVTESHWIIRQTAGFSGPSSTVNDYVSASDAGGFRIAATSAGKVAAIGYDGLFWSIWASDNGGSNWKYRDLFESSESGHSTGRAVTFSDQGFVIGVGGSQTAYSPDPSRSSHWNVRRGH